MTIRIDAQNILAVSHQASSSSCYSYAPFLSGGRAALGTSLSVRINQEGRPRKNQSACLPSRRPWSD